MNEFNLNVRGIAHDLNNQIMILMNALDRIVTLFPDDLDAVQAVKAAGHCALLAGQLLPRWQPRAIRVTSSVREIVSEAAMQVRPLLPAYNRLDVVCPVDCRIAAPPDAIQQALVNLCMNAIDAMDGPGFIRIEVEHVETALESRFAILSVRDTGPGVAHDLRERIFEPYFTTRAATTRALGGCGLGLHRVRETVLRSGGSISVESVFPHGACFRIVLPTV
jgi:signal transduction histidine kinase